MTRHLIHVGYPKSGSTFLQRWFERHPLLHYAEGGVAGFRNVYQMCHTDRTPYRYHVTSCEGLSTPHDRMGAFRMHGVGEVSDAVSGIKDRQAEVCDRLSTLYPGSYILVVTRGFREMVFSGYSQYVRTGGRMSRDEVYESIAERLFIDEHHSYDFDYLIGLYEEAFGAENVIVLPYELLRDDQRRFMRVLEDRLGLEHVELNVGRVNPSLAPEELYWYPVISRGVSAVASRLGPTRSGKVYGWYARKTYDNRLRPLISLLSRMRPGRKVTAEDFPCEILDHCVGKAERLRDDPLYAPYAREYLWDRAPRSSDVTAPRTSAGGA